MKDEKTSTQLLASAVSVPGGAHVLAYVASET